MSLCAFPLAMSVPVTEKSDTRRPNMRSRPPPPSVLATARTAAAIISTSAGRVKLTRRSMGHAAGCPQTTIGTRYATKRRHRGMRVLTISIEAPEDADSVWHLSAESQYWIFDDTPGGRVALEDQVLDLLTLLPLQRMGRHVREGLGGWRAMKRFEERATRARSLAMATPNRPVPRKEGAYNRGSKLDQTPLQCERVRYRHDPRPIIVGDSCPACDLGILAPGYSGAAAQTVWLGCPQCGWRCQQGEN